MDPKPHTGTVVNRRRAVVVGGGLAGLAAGVRLSAAGWKTLLLERRPFLGGRAYSFEDRETGVEVDNGQHVFVGACNEYQEFLRNIGAQDNVRIPNRLDAPVMRNGKVSRLKANALPGFLANTQALLSYGHLSPAAKARLFYGLARIRFVKRKPGGSLEDETFDSLLRRNMQNDETIENFWNLITLPALNDDIRDVNADMGVMLFQTALMGAPHNAAIGYPVVGLSSLAGTAASDFIHAAGGEVRCGVGVNDIGFEGGRMQVRTSAGETIQADACVVALMPDKMLDVLPDSNRKDPFFSQARMVQTAPIVGVHIWYDRPITDDIFVAAIDTPVQWVFNVTGMRESQEEDGGQHVVISLSGAWKWRDTPKAELRELFLSEMARLFPVAGAAKVKRFLVVKMLDATFRVVPGSGRYRLPQKTPVPGFFLAGDWTDTGWPSTMEGAVRSGNIASDLAIEHLKGLD